MPISEIQLLLSSLKSAGEITKTLFNLKVTGEVQGKIVEIQCLLMAAQSSAIDASNAQYVLQDKVRELEERLRELENWGEQTGRYTLVCPWRGPAQVYALKQARAEGESPHYLCPNCFHNKKRVILNPLETNNQLTCVCPACKSTMSTGCRGIGPPEFAEYFDKQES